MKLGSENLRGALLMMGSMAGFALNDAVIKGVMTDISLFGTIFWRGLPMVAALAIWCWMNGALAWRPGRRDGAMILLRTLAEVGATLTFLTALAHMELANATAILQSAPLAVTLAAALFLGEPLGWRRTVASIIGFLAVLLIIRPGTDAFNIFALFAVATVLFIVLRDLSTRQLSGSVPSVLVALVTAVTITLTGAIGAGPGILATPEPGQLLSLLAAAAFLIMGYVCSVMAMRTGEIAFVSPFRYTVLIWALILGYLVFGDIPDHWTLIGSTVIVATGLFNLYRERMRVGKALPRTTLYAAANGRHESGGQG